MKQGRKGRFLNVSLVSGNYCESMLINGLMVVDISL